MRNVDLSAMYDDPLDPSVMQFTTKPAKSCHGCIFQRQRISVCNEANESALRAGLVECESGVVYILKPEDIRQLSILGKS